MELFYKCAMLSPKLNNDQLRALAELSKNSHVNTLLKDWETNLTQALIDNEDSEKLRLFQGGARVIRELNTLIETADKKLRQK